MHKKDKIYVPPAEPLTSEYVPQVGDVVGITNYGGENKGIVFNDDGLCVAYYDGEYDSIEDVDIADTIGHVDFMDGLSNQHEARELTKAYFSTPTFTGTYAKRQAQWVKHHGLKVGSKVKIARAFKEDEDGYGSCGMSPRKRELVGGTSQIQQISYGYICVSENYWPYFVLEPVKE